MGVDLLIKTGLLTMDINDRIMKFNVACYDVSLNSYDISEVKRCLNQLYKKHLSVLMYGVGFIGIDVKEEYKMHIAYGKIFRHIFHLSLRSRINELLKVFHINSIHNLLKIRPLNV